MWPRNAPEKNPCERIAVYQTPTTNTIEVPCRISAEDGRGEADIDRGRHKPEFDAWKWVTMDEAVEGAVDFKREVYEALREGFGHLFRDENR